MPIATPQGTLDFRSVDKVTFVGASSNTVIDTTTGSLGVGVDGNGPTSNLHVVGHTRLEGDIDMLHTANTASIKLNSNVVTEFPRSKKLMKFPRVALTSASQGGYAVTSYEGTTSGAENYNVFNGIKTGTDRWSPSGPAYTNGSWNSTQSNGATVDVNGITWTGEWLQIQLPNKIALKSHIIQSRSSHIHRRPKKGVILASTNGTAWNLVDSWSDLISGSERQVSVDSINYYDYYRLVSIELELGIGDAVRTDIQEWELYGIPEYDPEAHGTDVVVKSVPNVPNTDWLEVYYDAKDLTDGSVTSVDDLTPGGTNDGTATNVTVSDEAFVFNGTSSLLESSTTITNSTGDIPHAFSLWVKPSDGDLDDTGNHYLIVYGTELNTGKWSSISISNKRFASVIHASVVRFGPEVRVGEWYHIVLNYKSGGIHNSERFDFFINGSQIDTTALSTGGSQAGSATLNLSSPAKLVLGGLFTGVERSSSTIANARLFNRVLSSDEIYQLYAYQKEYFGHGDLGMTLKAGRLGIGTSEPRAALDVRGDLRVDGHTQLETLAPRYYSSMQRGTFHNVSSHIITGFDHQAEGYATPVLGWEVHINFNHHRNMYATHVEIDGGYMSTAPGTRVAITEVATRKYDEDTSAFSFYTDKFYIGSDMANAHAAAYAVIRITNSQVPGIPSAIHAGNGNTVRYHMLGHTMYVKPGIGSCLDVAIGQIPGGNNARLHGIRVATGADNITGSYTVYTYH
jgi:hypothetical protein